MRPNAQRRAWLRRAKTLHRNAEGLFADMMDAVGADYVSGGGGYGDNLTDYADDLVIVADTLCSVIENDIARLKSRAASDDTQVGMEPSPSTAE